MAKKKKSDDQLKEIKRTEGPANFLKIVAENLKLFMDRVKGKYELIAKREEALDWIYTLANRMRTKTSKSTLDYQIKYPGVFYLFKYESKMYEEGTLPFYDSLPLVLIIEVHKDGFLGLNFHWIHPRWRAHILRKFITMFPDNFMNNTPVYGFTYKRLKVMLGGEFKYVNFAVRKYLFSQMIRLRGFNHIRVENKDMPKSILYISPRYVGITWKKAETVINKKNNGR